MVVKIFIIFLSLLPTLCEESSKTIVDDREISHIYSNSGYSKRFRYTHKNINKPNFFGKLPLHCEIDNILEYRSLNDEKVVEKIYNYLVKLSRVDVDLNLPDKDSRTIVFKLAGDIKLLKYLVENRADLNYLDKNNNSPLHNFLSQKTNSIDDEWISIAELLIKNSSVLNIKNNSKETPLILLIRHYKNGYNSDDISIKIFELIKIVLEKSDNIETDYDLYFRGSLKRAVDIVELFHEEDIDIDFYSYAYLLQNAVENDYRGCRHGDHKIEINESLKRILEFDDYIDRYNKYFLNHILSISFHSDYEYTELLVEKLGADTENNGHYTPLDILLGNYLGLRRDKLSEERRIRYDKGLKILKLLLNNGADPNYIDRRDKTILDRAINSNLEVEIIELIEEYGGKSIKDLDESNSPQLKAKILFDAIKKRDVEKVAKYVKYNFIEGLYYRSDSPLHFLLEESNWDIKCDKILDILLNSDMDINEHHPWFSPHTPLETILLNSDNPKNIEIAEKIKIHGGKITKYFINKRKYEDLNYSGLEFLERMGFEVIY